MSIRSINLKDYPQQFDIPNDYKTQYGEVTTDFKLIKNILSLIPVSCFSDPDKKWLDPCCGRGYFMIYLYKILFDGLEWAYPDKDKRHIHIIENMLFMVEINGEYIPDLYTIFGKRANIFHEDFLEIERKGFDIIIGNPPFNVGGLVKVPTNTKIDKRADGKAVWMHFIMKAISSLKNKGLLAMIIPSIWMKRDHAMYSFIRQYHIKKLHTLTGNETNKIFHGYAQTPTCYFSLLKMKSQEYPQAKKAISLYDKSIHTYIKFPIQSSIPLFAASVLKKLQGHLKKYGPILVKKTNMPHPSIKLSDTKTADFPFPNIKTCIITERIKPKLVINYSNKECPFYRKSKLVLAHKMYGFPYYDISGNYGLSNRDNYVIYNKTDRAFQILKAYLSTKFALYLFEGTRYRMKYLEKYIFEMIPDISIDPQVISEEINNEWLCNYFCLNKIERLAIEKHTKKNYSFFDI